jgi:putative oxidoreductase
MNTLHRFELWGDTHHPKWVDFIRIGLGIFLIYKGIDFLVHINVLQSLLAQSRSFGSFSAYMISMSVAFIHIAGGILITLGVLTRFAALIQIPILIGAVFLVNLSGEIFRPHSEIILSIVVLLLLVYFLIAGNGPLSVHLPNDEEQR